MAPIIPGREDNIKSCSVRLANRHMAAFFRLRRSCHSELAECATKQKEHTVLTLDSKTTHCALIRLWAHLFHVVAQRCLLPQPECACCLLRTLLLLAKGRSDALRQVSTARKGPTHNTQEFCKQVAYMCSGMEGVSLCMSTLLTCAVCRLPQSRRVDPTFQYSQL